MTATGRLFLAIDLPRAVREALAVWARREVGGRRELRRLPADALHLTVVFLGERPLSEADAIIGAAHAAARGPVPLGVAAPLWLAPRRPQVLTVRIADPAGALAALHRGLQSGLGAAVGWQPERRAFRPHVTVARVRRGVRVCPVDLAPPEPVRFDAEAVTLYRSHLGGAPARYEAVGRVVLPVSG